MYEFAINKIKLQRAIAACNASQDSDCVFETYKKLGGAVNPNFIAPVVEPAHISDVMPVVELEEPVVIEKAVIKTAVRKAKK